MNVEIPGKPGEIRGTVSITEDGTGTTENVRMDVKVSIPMVGGKIEGLIAELLTKALRAENHVGRRGWPTAAESSHRPRFSSSASRRRILITTVASTRNGPNASR